MGEGAGAGDGAGAGGGGSIAECVAGAFDGRIGSGKAGIASSDDDVSIVMFVG